MTSWDAIDLHLIVSPKLKVELLCELEIPAELYF